MLGVPLHQLLGQPRTSEFLRGLIARGRFANAYLFDGPSGVGKMTAALSFARAILCRSTDPEPAPPPPAAPLGLFAGISEEPAPEPATPSDDACGSCGSCRRAGNLAHPDLKFLFPVSGEERTLEQTVGETFENLRADPLFVFRYEKAASIRLSQTRELLRELAFRPFESSRRVVVVRDADRMREDQASAMLKSIEEPGASTVWVLTTARPARLPVTIRSRCQRVRFGPLQEALVGQVLERAARVPAPLARTIAALSSGSLGRALELRDTDPLDAQRKALELLGPARRNDPAGLWNAAQKFMNYGRTGRETLRRMADFHLLWLRDVLRARCGAPAELLVFGDREADLRREAATLDAPEIRRRMMVLEEMVRAIEGNVSADATIFSAMARAAGHRLGEGEWPRHSTARWNY
ncbi:MAG: hypothetical protein ABIS67_08485 [Candidatus Eisenbacteria bacterium]